MRERVGGRWGFRALALWALLWAAGGCALAFQEPGFQVAGLRVSGFGLTSGTAEIVLDVDNPNGYRLEVRGVDYALRVADEGSESGWRELSSGLLPDTVTLPSGDTTRVTLEVPFQYRALGAAMNAFLNSGGIEYQVEGRAVVHGPLGERRIPFRQAGRLEP